MSASPETPAIIASFGWLKEVGAQILAGQNTWNEKVGHVLWWCEPNRSPEDESAISYRKETVAAKG